MKAQESKSATPSSKRPVAAPAATNAEPAARPPLNVALIEDQPEVRESWIRLLNSFPDFSCTCACMSGEEAVRTIPQVKPDVVLMDIFLPRMSGIECTARLKMLMPNLQIVILTAMDDKELVFMALEAGADGYLLKRTKPADLRNALLDVLHGGVPMTSQVARFVIESFRRKGKGKGSLKGEVAQLSLREEQILQLLSQGYSNKMIADKLHLSVDTVCTHFKHVFAKLQVNSRTEAAVRYLELKGGAGAQGGSASPI